MRWWVGLALLVTACGGSPTAPGPSAPPATFSGTVTDTVSGAPVTGFTATLNGSRVTVSAPGYLTRETANAATVDLIPDRAPFDLTFYRQFARNALDTGSPDIIRVLGIAPAFYLQTGELSTSTAAAIESSIRAAVPAFTGNRFQVTAWSTGAAAQAPRSGTITIITAHDGDNGICGTTPIGASAGAVRLNLDAPRCNWPVVAAHEAGHALGFTHVARTDCLMNPGSTRLTSVTAPCELERYHGAIAYHRSAGNRDVDSD